MAECRMGNPGRLTTDIGPVIDSEAKVNIERHIQTMRSKGRPVFQAVRKTVKMPVNGKAAPLSPRR